ncbi:MAG: 2-C-methyl-D-erythritol 4-phosphate cytidylyltransferase [Candidatus Omnitrophota bacterium]|jgi:2-C-methyl-D-erythritol 4-phosphate cytidylyltransferase
MLFNVGVVIVCAGKGKRLGQDKAVIKLKGKPLFFCAYELFENIKQIKQIVIVLRKEHFGEARRLIKDKRVMFCEGGRERKDSVLNGVLALDESINYVLIHDGARPFTPKNVILNIIKELRKFPAVVCAVKSKDTLKSISKGFATKTLDRNNIFLVQTPQGFKKDTIIKAYGKLKNRVKVFDDAGALELMKGKVKIVEGSFSNIKITYPEDILLAKAIFGSRE